MGDRVDWKQPVQLAGREATNRPGVKRHGTDELQVTQVGLEFTARKDFAAPADSVLPLRVQQSGVLAGNHRDNAELSGESHGPTLKGVG